MAVLPLIIFSIISSIAGLDRKTTGKLGGIAVAYYAVTTFIAVVIGIIMCATIKPGRYGQEPLTAATASVGELSPVDTILDIIRNIVPENIVYAQSAQVTFDNLLFWLCYKSHGSNNILKYNKLYYTLNYEILD